METFAIVIGSGVALFLVVWAGNRMLQQERRGGGTVDGLGSFIDVFDPARARTDRDRKADENQTEVAPSPEDDDRPVTVDLRSGTARIRRPRQG